MALNLFKGISKAMAPLIAKKINKEDFLEQLREAWTPVVKKTSDIDLEVDNTMKRVQKSGFRKTFATIGITREDIQSVLLDIQKSKSATIVRNTPKVGRNSPCPCGSGKKYKKCCGDL